MARAGLAEYLTGVLTGVSPLRPLSMVLLDAHGQVLAEDVTAPGPLPAFDAAAIDGYAVRTVDLADARPAAPAKLAVVGDLRAASWQVARLSPGSCYAIAAGAPMPSGADAVVPTDWTDGGRASVLVSVAPSPDHGVRRVGETVGAGAVLAHAGTEVGPGLVGLLAAAGVGTVSVLPQPRVVMVATGDELVAAGQPSAPGRVVDVNSYLLTAAARDAGAKASRLGVVADDDEALRNMVEDQASRTDLIVVTGGTGGGPGDVTRRLFGQLGAVEFVTPALHPAAVIGFGRSGVDKTPVACLPGDPVGALVGFEVLVRPLLQRLAGAENPFRPSVKARLDDPVVSPHGVREFRPAYVTERRGGGYTVAPLAGGDSFLAGYARANALLVLGERVAELRAGSTVDVLLFDRSR